jgi:hypothetical protein
MSSFFSFNIYSTIWSCKLVHVQKSALCLETSCSTRALNILLFLLCILILIITTLFCDLFFCERNTQRLNKSNRKSKSFIRSYRKKSAFSQRAYFEDNLCISLFFVLLQIFMSYFFQILAKWGGIIELVNLRK